MKITLDQKELKTKARLTMQHDILQAKIVEAGIFKELLVMRSALGIREQDEWLMRLAIINGIPSEKIKDFQFTNDGHIEVGGDHEPTVAGPDAEVGS